MYPEEYNDPVDASIQTGGRPKNWEEILQSTGLPIAISPLHDSDVNDDGTSKKPHYHVLLAFDGPTTFQCVSDIADSVNGTLVIPVNSCKGMYRYHLHLDNPEKFPYWQSVGDPGRKFINAFNIDDYSSMTTSEISQMQQLVFNIIRENKIFEYCDLIDYLQFNDIQAFDFVTHHTMVFKGYCDSKRNKMKRNKEI